MAEFSDSLPPFTEFEIGAVETVLGRRLPPSLVELLKHHNGGVPTKNLYKKRGRSYYFQYLFPISSWKQPNLKEQIESSTFLTARELIPFGIDGAGDFFAVSELDGSVHVCGLDGTESLLEGSLLLFLEKLEGEKIKSRECGDIRMAAVAKSGDASKLQEYLSEGFSIGGKNSEGLSLAQLCAINGNVLMLEAIFNIKGPLDGAIHYAAKFNQRPIIAFLIGIGRSVVEPDDKGALPVDYVKANPPLKKYLAELAARS